MQIIYIQAQTSASFVRLSFFSWAAPSEIADRIYLNNLIRHGMVLGGHRFRPRHVGAVGVKGVLSLWCLPALLLFGAFAGQLEARASSWCAINIVWCFLLVALLAADCCILM